MNINFGGGCLSRIKDILVDKLDMPYELLNDDVKLTMYWKKRIIIERHKGIAVYREDQVKIAYSGGMVCISGKGMTIKNYGKDDIIIDGELCGVTYEEV